MPITEVWHDLPSVALAGAVAGAGLMFANVAFDRGVPQYVSRKIGHIFGGIAFLLGVELFTAPFWALVLPALFALLLLGARLVRPATFRGVGGSGRSDKAVSEVWFALVALPVFALTWLWLRRPELGLAALLFMAWGDGATGMVRARLYRRPVKGWWGSLAMLAVCLLISLALVRPFWVGIVASVSVTLVERTCGDCGPVKWADDNWAISVVGVAVLTALLALTHQL
jgi:phytol kinase